MGTRRTHRYRAAARAMSAAAAAIASSGCQARPPSDVGPPACDVARACCELGRVRSSRWDPAGAAGCVGRDLSTRDWAGGGDLGASGLESQGGVLRLRPRTVTRTGVVWITSTGENKVAKYDSATGRELLRVPTWGAFPNRTAVAADGSVWVTNRDSGSYVHIAADGSVACASPHRTCVTRAAGIDAAGDVWIGCHDARSLIRVSAAKTQGSVEVSEGSGGAKKQVPRCLEMGRVQLASTAPYGLVTDDKGIAWVTANAGRTIAKVDTAAGKVVGEYDVAADPTLAAQGRGCWDPYGIAIDQEGNPWLANMRCRNVVKIDGATGKVAGVFHGGPDGMARPRALGLDLAGHVWVADNGSSFVDELLPSGAWVKRVDLAACGGPSPGTLGTGSDVDGNLWTVLQSAGKVAKFSARGVLIGCYPDGAQTPLLKSPYTYSDLTGSSLGLVTSKLGRWRAIVEQDRLLRWLLVSYRTTTPPKTSVCLRVRAAKSRERLARASWSEPFCKSAGDREVTTWPLVDGSGAQVVPSAPVLEIEVRLASEDPAVSPTIADLSIAAEVAPPIADRDGDGVADAEDACPDRAEDGKGPLPDDGCPDKDGDGIADDRDRCPDLPEDHVLPGAQDGCPDKDGDGIPDPDDACPGAKEDGHAPAPQDGCPDRDSDAVPDASDKCPAIPGEPKYSGCPLVHAAGDDIQMADKIMFQEGSARIDDRSAELLDGIAALLRANDKVGLVEVAGHANRHGTDALNVKLTRDRSAAVVAALVKRGVEAKRLRSAGYGAVCPAVAGETPEADEANRRVELKVLVRGGAPTAVRWGGCAEAEKKGMKPPAVPGAKQPAAVPAKKPAPAPPGPGPKAPPKPKAPSKR